MPASNQPPASQRADNDPLQRLLDTVLVAVVRSPDDACLVDVAEALVAGGIDAIEITFTVPRAPQVLQRVADRLGDSVLLGAGTVLDAETARAAILAGARFVVSPVVAPDVVAMARRYACPAMAGALTPTEVFQAWQAGSDIVKVFPANIGGPGYLKALHGPLPQIRLMPTGGVDLNTATAFLESGACALGVGTALVSQQILADRRWDELTERARQYREIVRRFRSESGA